MARRKTSDASGEMAFGTLDMLVLRALMSGPAHGHTIAHVIEHTSDHVLQVEHGSLYPALHRLEDQGLIACFWGTSENNRKAKYYRITPAGKTHLVKERSRWETLVQAVGQCSARHGVSAGGSDSCGAARVTTMAEEIESISRMRPASV